MSEDPLLPAVRGIVEGGYDFNAVEAIGLLKEAGFAIVPASGPDFDAAVERAARAFWGARFDRTGRWPMPPDRQWRDFVFAIRVFTGEIR